MFLSTAAVRNLRPNFDHDHPRYMIYHQDTGSGVHVHAVEMYPRVAPIVGSTQVLKIGDLGKVSDCVFEGTVGSLVFLGGKTMGILGRGDVSVAAELHHWVSGL